MYKRAAVSAVNSAEEARTFAIVANAEHDQCYQRFICDLATGNLPKSENEVILELFRQEAEEGTPKHTYGKAAKFGELVRDIRACEERYSCPLSGHQINRLI